MSAYELNKTILKDSANLKAYYRFESGALTTDSSGNSHTLTAISDPADTTGVYGGAVALDSDDAFSHADHADFKPTGAFSISAWINLNASGSNQTIFQSYSQNSNVAGLQFVVTAAGKLNCVVGKNTGVTLNTDYKDLTAATTLSDSTTYHVVLTWDTATLRIYLNGGQDGSVASTIAPAYAATSYIRVGCANASGTNINFFNGWMDDLAIFNGTALSADQVKELYEGRYIGEWMPQANLVGLWHLNGNSTDFSGTGAHGTDTAITYGTAYGKISQGASFNGTSSVIACGTSNTLNLTGDMTILAWIKPTSLNVYQMIFRRGSSTGYQLEINNANNTFFFTARGGNTATANTNSLTAGVWQLVGISKSGTTVTSYVNGSSVGSTGSITVTSDAGQTTYIGANGSGTEEFAGSMDEVAIFSRALTAAEIRHWYAWSSGRYL